MIYGPKRVNDLVNGPKYDDIVLPCWDKNEYSKGNWNCEPPNFGPNHQISAIVFGPQFVRLRNAPKICLVTYTKTPWSFQFVHKISCGYEITQIPLKVLNRFHKIPFSLISI